MTVPAIVIEREMLQNKAPRRIVRLHFSPPGRRFCPLSGTVVLGQAFSESPLLFSVTVQNFNHISRAWRRNHLTLREITACLCRRTRWSLALPSLPYALTDSISINGL
jgi:hypothetical protein